MVVLEMALSAFSRTVKVLSFEMPVSSETEMPVSSETEMPVSSETEMPVSSATEMPVSSATEMPVSSETRCLYRVKRDILTENYSR